MSDNYEQPVEPMSRAEDILRGNTSTVPMSRIEALLKQIIEGGGGGGSTVTITTDYQAGTKIATLTIDGMDYNIYIPTDQIGSIVSISTDYQAGTKIATLTIDNTPYNIYIPQDQVGAKTYNGVNAPASSLGNEGDLYLKIDSESKEATLYTEQWSPRDLGTVMRIKYSDTAKTFDTVSFSCNNVSFFTNIPFSEIPISTDPINNGYHRQDEWGFVQCDVSRDDDYLYFTVSKQSGSAVYTFFSCSITYTEATGISDIYGKIGGKWIPYTKSSDTPTS